MSDTGDKQPEEFPEVTEGTDQDATDDAQTPMAMTHFGSAIWS